MNTVISLSLYYWLERLYLHHWVTLSKIFWAYMYGSISVLLCTIDLYVYLYANTTVPCLLEFYSLEIRRLSPQTLFCLKIVLVLLGPLHILIHFTVILLNLCPRKRLSGFLQQLGGVYRSICGVPLKQHWDFPFMSMVYLLIYSELL